MMYGEEEETAATVKVLGSGLNGKVYICSTDRVGSF